MMPPMKPIAVLALPAALMVFDAVAAKPKWDQVRGNDAAKLSIDTASVKRSGDQVRVSYLVDYAKPQSDRLYQVTYRSVVTSATLRCKPRTVLFGMSEMYTGPGATGVIVASAQPDPKERVYAPIEKGTSDEDLWRRVCEKAPAAKPPEKKP
jgi:hypothetical protein